jgi:hypothetical protein
MKMAFRSDDHGVSPSELGEGNVGIEVCTSDDRAALTGVLDFHAVAQKVLAFANIYGDRQSLADSSPSATAQ